MALAAGAGAPAGEGEQALFAVGFAPILGAALLPWVIETRGRGLVN